MNPGGLRNKINKYQCEHCIFQSRLKQTMDQHQKEAHSPKILRSTERRANIWK